MGYRPALELVGIVQLLELARQLVLGPAPGRLVELGRALPVGQLPMVTVYQMFGQALGRVLGCHLGRRARFAQRLRYQPVT